MNSWYVYILYLANDTYYTGITNDLAKRLKKHEAGTGSKYVRAHLPLKLHYTELKRNRSAALKREYEIKQLTKQQKEQLRSKDE